MLLQTTNDYYNYIGTQDSHIALVVSVNCFSPFLIIAVGPGDAVFGGTVHD